MVDPHQTHRSADQDKLGVLRRLDQFRKWRSLDDSRYCLCCQRLITGRQIKVTEGTGGEGSLRLTCPTEQCHSIPMDWVLPNDEVLAKIRERQDLPPPSGLDQHHFNPRRNSFAARLHRRIAFLKRANAERPGAA